MFVHGGCASKRNAPESQPVPQEALTSDTVTQRLLREQQERERADSITRAAQQAAAQPQAVATPAPRPPSAPAERCILDLTNLPGTQMAANRDPVTGRYFTVVSGGLRGQCRGQMITIEADSAESYDQARMYILIGNVKYREPRVSIDASRAVYYQSEERLVLQNNVHALMHRSGATLDGPHVEYFRAVRGLRARDRVVATQRPRLTYVEKDSTGRPLAPVVLRANMITGEGDSTFIASNEVRLERQDVLASGDSGYLDAARQFARLMKGPVIESRGPQAYTLRGRTIDMFGATRQLERVIAVDSASARSSQFTLVADTIDMRVSLNRLQRAFAFGPAGAHVTTPERDVIADSLDIVMPNQRIRELRAVGKAYAESDPDSNKVRTDERDWIRGDTVIARFDSVAAGDTSSSPRLLELVASGEASAYYQVPGDSAHRDKPGINYTRGRVIRLEMAQGQVETVSVLDKVSGVFLEPVNEADVPPNQGRNRSRPGTPPVRPPARRPPQK
jgi:lipopolysaccharide export system protein LptA